MKTKALKSINKYNMISNGDNIVVGFSGGADSTSLIHFLLQIKDEYNLTISACHLNHNIRGQEALRDLNFCKDYCELNGIEFFEFSVDIKKLSKDTGKSEELCGREQRYKIFTQLANKLDAKIALAHTLSDNAETIIWNITRGTALKGLIGIPAVRDFIIRPLIDCTREDIELYCVQNELNFVTDSTNLTDEYTRNKIRNNIIPVMKNLNSNALNNINRMSQTLQLENDFIEQTCNSILKEIKDINKYNKNKLLLCHSAIINRVIAKILKDNKIEISKKTIKDVLQSIKLKNSKMEIKKDIYLTVENEYFYIENKEELQEYFEINAKIGYNIPYNGKAVEIKLCNCENFENLVNKNRKSLKFALDYDKIVPGIKIRQKKDGDKINLYNRNGTKSLKKLFNENKYTQNDKSKTIIISDDKGVIWTEKFGCDKRVCVDQNTKNIFLIKVMEDTNEK